MLFNFHTQNSVIKTENKSIEVNTKKRVKPFGRIEIPSEKGTQLGEFPAMASHCIIVVYDLGIGVEFLTVGFSFVEE